MYRAFGVHFFLAHPVQWFYITVVCLVISRWFVTCWCWHYLWVSIVKLNLPVLCICCLCSVIIVTVVYFRTFILIGRTAGMVSGLCRVAQKIGTHFLYALTLVSINRFSKLFHCQIHKEICNNTVTKDPTTPHVCRYTTLWNVSVLKQQLEDKTTYVTTRFKKLTTENNVFIVSVIVLQVL